MEFFEDVTEEQYTTMRARLESLEEEEIVKKLARFIDDETGKLMEEIGAKSGDIAPDQEWEKIECVTKIAEIIVKVAYQNL